jgi:hypothetical protein
MKTVIGVLIAAMIPVQSLMMFLESVLHKGKKENILLTRLAAARERNRLEFFFVNGAL